MHTCAQAYSLGGKNGDGEVVRGVGTAAAVLSTFYLLIGHAL